MTVSSKITDAADAATFQTFVEATRPLAGATNLLFARLGAVALAYQSQIAPMIATYGLDPADVVDFPIGPAGAQRVTLADIESLMTSVGTAIASLGTMQQQALNLKFSGLLGSMG